MRIDSILDDVLEDLLRLRHQLNPVIRTMRDNMAGQPGAQSFDTIARGARSVHWCWDHEREVAACHKRGDFCTGESVPTDDPTGEAACDVDQVRDDHRHTVKDIQALRVISDRLLARFVRYQRRAATEKERQVTQRANEPGCELCARLGTHTPPRVLSSDVKGNLERPHRLCTWHYEFVLSTGRKPTQPEEEMHRDGRPVRLKAS